jgi:hypothetical protein
MSWVHDTGYGPALDHEGGVADVLEVGTDPSTPPTSSIPGSPAGARHASAAGTAPEFYLRSEWPDTEYALAPYRSSSAAERNGNEHLRAALPVMAIHDLTQQRAQAQDDLDDAVSAARAASVSWTIIADAAGVP